MARIRTIKPEFWTDEDISSISEPARLLAIGILNQCDDEGYFKANPMLLKAAVFPLCEPSVSIHVMLSELSEIGYILISEGTDGKQYGKVRTFKSHQRVNRPSPSKIKGLCDFTECSVRTHESITIGKERKGKEQGKEQGKNNLSTDVDFSPAIELWNGFAKANDLKTITGITPSRRKAIKSAHKIYLQNRKALGRDSAPAKSELELVTALVEVAISTHSQFHLGANDRGWKMNFDYLLTRKVVDRVTEFGSLES